MSGLKCSVCNYNTSDTISNDSDITSKIKVLEIHSLATHQGVNQQGNAGGELNQQTSYKQDNTRVQLEQQVGCRQGNGIEELDQQNWINQSFPESNLVPILTVPNDATPIYNVNIPPPGSSNNEFEKVVAEPTTVTSKNVETAGPSQKRKLASSGNKEKKEKKGRYDERELNTPSPLPKPPTPCYSNNASLEFEKVVAEPTTVTSNNVETAGPSQKRKLASSGNKEKKEKKGRYDERELNTPSPLPKPPTPCYSNNASLLSCITEPVEPASPSSSMFSSTYAEDDGENNKLTDLDDDDDEEAVDNGAVGKLNDYTDLFNESDSFTVSDHESLRRSLKFQTYLRAEDRIDANKFSSFMCEFAQKMRCLNHITTEAHKAINKEHQTLFGAIMVNHFSKWTGMCFIDEGEIRKKNHLEISIKNFESRILAIGKIIKGKKK